MADNFNGRFKLTTSTNCSEFYKSVGLPENEIEKLSPIDNPANDVQIVQKLTNGEMSMEYYIGERKAKEERCQLGETRSIQHEGVTITITTKLEGDKLVDITQRPGKEETKYVRTVDGDKLTVEMTSSGGVRAVKELVRV